MNSVAFTPDGQHVVSASQDRTLGLWEVASGQEIARLAADDPFASPRIAADGQRLVAGGRRVHLNDIRIDGANKAASARS